MENQEVLDLTKLTREELTVKLEKALKSASTYEGCTDGSYKAALYHNGYYSVKRELERRGE
jgi:hypothetical protein